VVNSDQILVDQAFDVFSTGLEVLLNYLVICFEFFALCAPNYSSLISGWGRELGSVLA
jgi:hypothetical protein